MFPLSALVKIMLGCSLLKLTVDLSSRLILTSVRLADPFFEIKLLKEGIIEFLMGFKKIGTIFNLIDRAILLSHPKLHEKNINLCINILLENGYSLQMTFTTLIKELEI